MNCAVLSKTELSDMGETIFKLAPPNHRQQHTCIFSAVARLPVGAQGAPRDPSLRGPKRSIDVLLNF